MLTPSKAPTMSDIFALQEIAKTLPQEDYPVVHHHSDGVYVREFHMPAGYFVIGKEHKTRHLNILTKGRCTVWTVHGRHDLDASSGPVTFESMAGMKKVVLAYEDIVWMTIHQTEETDQDRLEGNLIKPEEQLELFPELENDYFGGKLPCLGDSLGLPQLV